MEQPVVVIDQTRPPVKKVSKMFYLSSYIGTIAGSVIIIVVFTVLLVMMSMTQTDMQEWVIVVGIVGLFMLLYAVIIYCVVIFMRLLYKAWQAIQDGLQRTTPGKVVGFSFIPYFNFYWVFQAYWGYAKDYNAFLDRNNLTVKKLSENLFLAYCITNTACLIPGINVLAVFAATVMGAMIIGQQCDSINNLAESN